NASDLLTLSLNDNIARVGILTMMSATDRTQQEAWLNDIKTTSAEQAEISVRLFDRFKNNPAALRKLDEWRTAREAFKQTRDNELIPAILAGKAEEQRATILGIQTERFNKMSTI